MAFCMNMGALLSGRLSFVGKAVVVAVCPSESCDLVTLLCSLRTAQSTVTDCRTLAAQLLMSSEPSNFASYPSQNRPVTLSVSQACQI